MQGVGGQDQAIRIPSSRERGSPLRAITQQMLKNSALVVVANALARVADRCPIGGQSAPIQACRGIACCIPNQPASRISPPLRYLVSGRTISGSIVSRKPHI